MSSNVDGRPTLEHLIPAGISFLINQRPLLWSENPQEYDALQHSIFAELTPDGAIECILVKSLVDLIWELRRMKTMKQVAINFSVLEVASEHFSPGFEYEQKYQKRPRVLLTVRSAVVGKEEGELCDDETSFEDYRERYHLTPEMLNYETYIREADNINSVNRECDRLEGRFHRLLKDFETRRASLAAMARTLVAREAAEVIDPPIVG